MFIVAGAQYVQLHAALTGLVQILQFKGQTGEAASIREIVTRGDYMMNTTNRDSTTEQWCASSLTQLRCYPNREGLLGPQRSRL